MNSNKHKEKIFSKCIKNNSIGTLSQITSANSLIPFLVGSITCDLSEFCDPVVLISLSGSISPVPPIARFSEYFFRLKRYSNCTAVYISNNLSPGISLISNTESFLYQLYDYEPLACPCSKTITYCIELVPGVITGLSRFSFNDLVITAYVYERSSSLIRCNAGNTITLLNSTTGTSLTVPPTELGYISIDTSKYFKLNVLLIYSGDLSYRVINNSTTVPIPPITAAIQINKNYVNGCEESLPPYNIFTSTAVAPTFSFFFSESFCGQICDCISECTPCIIYKPTLIIDSPLRFQSELSLTNISFTAYITEDC